MPSFKFDTKVFDEKIAKIKQNLKAPDLSYSCLIATSDKITEFYHVAPTFLIWLLGYEIPNSIFVISFEKSMAYLFCKKEKYQYLEGFNNKLTVKIRIHDLEDFEEAVAKEEFGEQSSALFLKDKSRNDTLEGILNKTLKFCETKFVLSDAKALVLELFSVKSEDEIKNSKNAAELCSAVYRHFIVPEIETVIDEDISTTYKKLSASIQKVVGTPSKVKVNINSNYVSCCYPPLVQSGGEYSLRLSASPSAKRLSVASSCPVLVSLGISFKSYCANISRTLLFNPTEGQKRMYAVACDAFEAAKSALKPEALLCDVWDKAFKTIEQKAPEKVENFSKNCGFGIGLQFREAMFTISKANSRKVKTGMVFNLCIGLKNVEDTVADITYAIQIAETILVTTDGNEVLTKAPMKLKNVSYEIEKKEKMEEEISGSVFNAALVGEKRKTRQKADIAGSVGDEIKRKHMKILDEKIKNAMNTDFTPEEKPKKDNIKKSYNDFSDVPRVANPYKVYADEKSNSILVPYHGGFYAVHIDYVKNAQISKSEKLVLLQISMNTKLMKKTPGEAVLKELIIKSKNSSNFQEIVRKVKSMQKSSLHEKNLAKRVNFTEKELIRIKDRTNLPRLCNLKMRPVMVGRRSTVGVLEAHKNGFLFTLNYPKIKPTKIQIFYENVRFAFYQPAANNAAVLIHLFLHREIYCNKKSAKEVQFYIDVVDSSQNVDRNSRGDIDGAREEQREAFYKKKLNKIFKKFTKSATEVSESFSPSFGLRFDMPLEDLKFFGVPERSTVSIYPTTDCLVALEEFPSFVLPINDIEIIHFERVQFQLRNFDVVFVMKDLTTFKRIDAIPIESFENLKRYFEDANIVYFTGSINLDWNRVLRQINSDRQKFWESGGWKFLGGKAEEESGSETETEEFESADESAESDYDEESDGVEEEEDEDQESFEENDEEEDDLEEDESEA